MRVATFNVENLDVPRRHQVPLKDRVAVLRSQLLALRADVLCLQEVSAHIDSQRERHEFRALDQLVESTPYASFARATTMETRAEPSPKHNLVVLSRLPIAAAQRHWHDLVEPPVAALSTTPAPRVEHIRWDRPVLEVRVTCPDGRPLTLFNAHLRAPLAAAIEGQKLGSLAWRTVQGWAEGYFIAAVKRVGQALELRKHVDRVLDEDPSAWIVVAGDLNEDASGSALRLLIADADDTGNPALSGRSLVPLEERIESERRYSVLYRGQRQMHDHLLASQSIAKLGVGTSVHNDDLLDEYDAGRSVEPLGSLHAPLIAEFEL